jgi:hypothetical protein
MKIAIDQYYMSYQLIKSLKLAPPKDTNRSIKILALGVKLLEAVVDLRVPFDAWKWNWFLVWQGTEL